MCAKCLYGFILLYFREKFLFMKSIAAYRSEFLTYLEQSIQTQEPENLYDPMVYILNLGGKRLRPISILMAAELFGCSYKKALDAALAIEIFHNFSLVHDDIMDEAPLRRGKTAVHKKWDLNTGILSGDAMLIKAYQLFENYEGETFRDLAKLFSKTAIKVCEGQQYDIDFENKQSVSIPEYLKMIKYKTAVLVGAAMEMGAVIAEASKENRKRIYEYGLNIGLAFQLKDDYLDIFGDFEKFGKQIGGDIIENKKTFMYLRALEKTDEADQKKLRKLYAETPKDIKDKIETVTRIFKKNEIDQESLREIEKYTAKAFQIIEEIPIAEDKKEVLRGFGQKLMNRES